MEEFATTVCRRIRLAAAVLVCLALVASCGGERATETPKTTAAVASPAADQPSRVVAVGDLHGDVTATRAVLRIARLIDERDRWAGGDAVLVQVGDRLDRGDDERAVMDLLFALRDQAPATGGRVVLLNGNHEYFALAGDFRYVPESACAAFADLEDLDTARLPCAGAGPACARRCAALLPDGPYGRRLAELPVAAVVGDTAFAHAALFPEHARQGLDRLNDEARAFARGELPDLPAFLDRGARSVTWSRDLGAETVDPAACADVAETLSILGVRRLAIGHTVQERINPACDGLVWRVDTGMCAHYGGAPQALEILRGEVRVLAGAGDPSSTREFPPPGRPVL